MDRQLIPETFVVNLLFAGGTLAVMTYGNAGEPFDDSGYFIQQVRASELHIMDGEYIFHSSRFGETRLELGSGVQMVEADQQKLIRTFDRYLLGLILMALDDMIIDTPTLIEMIDRVRETRRLFDHPNPARTDEGLVVMEMVEITEDAELEAEAFGRQGGETLPLIPITISNGLFLLAFYPDGSVRYHFAHFLAPITTPVVLQQVQQAVTEAVSDPGIRANEPITA
jgi:hypothetical protein